MGKNNLKYFEKYKNKIENFGYFNSYIYMYNLIKRWEIRWLLMNLSILI